MIPIEINNKYAYINYSGQIVISPRYHYATEFHNGFARVTNDKDEIFFINKSGDMMFDRLFNDATEFYNNYSSVKFVENNKVRIAILEVNGNLKIFENDIIEVIPTACGNYIHTIHGNDGHNTPEDKIRHGLLDAKSYEFVLTPKHKRLGLALGGLIIEELETEHFSQGVGQRHLEIKTGKPVSDLYCYMSMFYDNYAIVVTDEKSVFKFYNKEYKPAFDNLSFDHIQDFSDGLAAFRNFRENHLHGFINIDGNIQIHTEFPEMSDFYQGLAVVHGMKNRWTIKGRQNQELAGLINKQGKWVRHPIEAAIIEGAGDYPYFFIDFDNGKREVLKPDGSVIYNDKK